MSWIGSLVGRFARLIARGMVRLYYPKILVEGGGQIPATGAVLLVANHANSLIDAVMISLAARRPVHYLAKAPLFDIPVMGAMMRALGMLPAFRGMDDPSQLKRNLESLGAGARFLGQGAAVGLFPEGKSHDSLKLAMIRSGAARMALQSFHEGAPDCVIVPVGINYEQKERFRSTVWILVGRPIRVGELLAEFEGEERRGLRALTQAIESRLKEVVIHLEEEDWEPYVSHLEALIAFPNEKSADAVEPLRRRKQIAEAINYFAVQDRAKAEAMMTAMRQHAQRIQVAGLDVRSPLVRSQGLRLSLELTGQALRLALGLLPALLGTLHHLVPFLVVRAVAHRMQAPGRMTVSLTRLGFGFPLYGLWYAGVWWVLSRYFLPWVAWTWTLAMPLAGIFALVYWRGAREIARTWWSQLRLLARQSALERFRKEQEQLAQEIDVMARHYRDLPGPGAALPGPAAPLSPPRTGHWFLAVLALALLVFLFLSPDPSRDSSLPMYSQEKGLNLRQLAAAALEEQLRQDGAALQNIIEGVEHLERRALAFREDLVSGRRDFYRPADNDALRQLLLSYLNYRAALLRIIWKYQGYGELPESAARWKALATGCTAAFLLYDASAKLVSEFAQSSESIRKLNEAEPIWGIPAGIYDTVQRNVQAPEVQRALKTAYDDYQAAQSSAEAARWKELEPYRSFHAVLSRPRLAAVREGKFEPAFPARQLIEEAAGRTESIVYTVQSTISTWIGDTRVRVPRGGVPLIQNRQLAQLRRLLRPGDIILERRNWYLSNAFLPGYWPHGAIYLGSAAQLARLGLDQAPAFVSRWPRLLEADPDGHEKVILESVSEGVVFASLEHSVGKADAVAVLRPRLEESVLRECLARAVSHEGKPYDFDFDFFSTDKLVCTELIYRSYDGHLSLPLVDVLGRKTLPAIELVKKFARQAGTGADQLEFVAFLEGEEASGTATFRDVEAFVGTLERSALTWFH